ncbi:MAG: HEAT repeat domain-containing protein [Fuerstiella sp.]
MMNAILGWVICSILLISPQQSAFAARKTTGIPRYDASVARAVEYLTGIDDVAEKEKTLIAYALLKAGEPESSPLVAAGIELAHERGMSKGYRGYDHIYYSGIDALLLSSVDPEKHKPALQNIADYVSAQIQGNGGWSDGPKGASDTSMCQYGMLALWSASAAGCKVSPGVVEANARWHLSNGNPDGAWAYRPGTSKGTGAVSTHNMAMAGAGSLGIARLLLFGSKSRKKSQAEEKVLGILSKEDGTEKKESKATGSAFPGYKPSLSVGQLDSRVQRAFQWIEVRFPPSGAQYLQKQYFYYALERAATLHTGDEGWFTQYGDVLLTLQAEDGSFPKTFTNPRIGSAFAILYFMRSTKQILDKSYAAGLQAGGRLDDLRKKKETKDIGPLDELLAQMQDVNFNELDGIDAEAVAEKIAFGSREELIGNMELLKKLLKHPDATNRQAAYFALGRTGDFALIPEMLKGLRDANIDVNVQALDALRYLSRKPNGFGLTMTPFEGVESADDETKLKAANAWRTKAYLTWGNWYRSVRPYDESGGLDELELKAGAFNR